MSFHGRRSVTKIALAVATAGLMSLATAPLLTSPAYAAALPTNPLIPAQGAYFGAAVPEDASVSNQQEILDYERALGRKLDLERVYRRFDDNMVNDAMRWDRDNNRNVILSVNSLTRDGQPILWSDIAAGRYDSTIARNADEIKAFGAPVWFSFNHEPEDDVAAGDAAEFVAAWRHYVDIFRARGATNVSWTWIMMAYSFRAGSGFRAPSFYPGDSYVDFVAADGYNWFTCREADWSSFESIFSDFHAFGLAHNKPEIIAEYASSEDTAVPGRKAQWLRDMAATVAAWPQVKAISYWGPAGCFDVASTPASFEAFASISMQPDLHVRPTAELTVSSTSGATPMNVTFDGSASNSLRGPLAEWSFEPGDGAASVSGSGTPPSALAHTYLATGTVPVTRTATLRVRDRNGQWDWSTQSVTVSPAPIVTTGAVVNFAVSTAQVAGRVDSNALPTSYYVQHGLTTGYGSMTGNGILPGSDRPAAVSVAMAGLAPASTYHYRLVAHNAAGTAYGADRTLTTRGAATAASYGAGDFTVGGATVRGAVDANGIASTYRVEYGVTTAYGRASNWTAAGSGMFSKSIAVVLSGLAGSTTYHYRVVASNSAGTGSSTDRTFTTVGAPAVRTDGASSLTASGARIGGWVDSNQLATTYSFQYGPTTSYSNSTASTATAVEWGANVAPVQLSGLSGRTTYHYRITATNAAGRAVGADRTFITK